MMHYYLYKLELDGTQIKGKFCDAETAAAGIWKGLPASSARRRQAAVRAPRAVLRLRMCTARLLATNASPAPCRL